MPPPFGPAGPCHHPSYWLASVAQPLYQLVSATTRHIRWPMPPTLVSTGQCPCTSRPPPSSPQLASANSTHTSWRLRSKLSASYQVSSAQQPSYLLASANTLHNSFHPFTSWPVPPTLIPDGQCRPTSYQLVSTTTPSYQLASVPPALGWYFMVYLPDDPCGLHLYARLEFGAWLF
jgi:hypothetical protein